VAARVERHAFLLPGPDRREPSRGVRTLARMEVRMGNLNAMSTEHKAKIALAECRKRGRTSDVFLSYIDRTTGKVVDFVSPQEIVEETADYFVHRHYVAGQAPRKADSRIKWSEVLEIRVGEDQYVHNIYKLHAESAHLCLHKYTPWESTACCLSYPHCDCKRMRKHVCSVCGNVEFEKGGVVRPGR
jgi:hypothetical protein